MRAREWAGRATSGRAEAVGARCTVEAPDWGQDRPGGDYDAQPMPTYNYSACAASNGVSVAVPPHVAERRQAFQDVLRSGRIEAPALRDRVCRGRSG